MGHTKEELKTNDQEPCRITADNGRIVIEVWGYEEDSEKCKQMSKDIVSSYNSHDELVKQNKELLRLANLVNDSFGGGCVITFNDQDIKDFGNIIESINNAKS